VAREVRELLAALGVRRIEDLIGRTEYLETLPGETPRQRKLDLTPLLSRDGLAADSPQFCVAPSNAPFTKASLRKKWSRTCARPLPAAGAASGTTR